ncbi:hypothetical protein LCGC14_2260870 [marine sediment metagenome]|uniref:Uncharacterized protein n=1 Tax=marine sediment metagenome TaxID=412755 RepID=A0A0F9DM46_9ZZZZ
MRKAEDFKKQAKKKKITRWGIHNCSGCGYACGYLINGDKVKYDSGCDCTTYNQIRESNWQSIADQYNMQTNKDVIKEMDKFWGFK